MMEALRTWLYGVFCAALLLYCALLLLHGLIRDALERRKRA